jgi:hypothetical protein
MRCLRQLLVIPVLCTCAAVAADTAAKPAPGASTEAACPPVSSPDAGDRKVVRGMDNAAPSKGLPLPPPRAFQIACQKPDALTEQTVAGETVLSINNNGIGRATITCLLQQWPPEVVLRARLRGLESLTIANEQVEWQASVLSHSGYPAALHLLRDGKQGPPLTNDSPYWAAIQRMDAAGKPVAGLPPEDGWFEIRIPRILLTKKLELKLAWIDFYR